MAIQSRQTLAAFCAFCFGVNDSPGGRIFVNPVFAHICDCDDNERLDKISSNQAFGSFIYAPFHVRKRSRRIENILAVV